MAFQRNRKKILGMVISNQENKTENEQELVDGKILLRECGITSAVEASPDTSRWRLDKDGQISIVVGRSEAYVKTCGELTEQDRILLINELNALIDAGTAPWMGIRGWLDSNNYYDFDSFMGVLRHSGNIDTLDANTLPFIYTRLQSYIDKVKTYDSESEKWFDRLVKEVKYYATETDALKEMGTFLQILENGIDRKPRNITQYVRDRVESFRQEATAKGLAFTTDLTNEDLTVPSCDLNLMGVLIDNLIQNAIKYTKKGSVKVRLVRKMMKPEIGSQEEDDSVVLEVEDTGIGIPEKEMVKIFGRGYRASNAADVQGTGIGLDVVYRIARLMGGNVFVQSELGKGTTFTIRLPVVSEPSPAAETVEKRVNVTPNILSSDSDTRKKAMSEMQMSANLAKDESSIERALEAARSISEEHIGIRAFAIITVASEMLKYDKYRARAEEIFSEMLTLISSLDSVSVQLELTGHLILHMPKKPPFQEKGDELLERVIASGVAAKNVFLWRVFSYLIQDKDRIDKVTAKIEELEIPNDEKVRLLENTASAVAKYEGYSKKADEIFDKAIALARTMNDVQRETHLLFIALDMFTAKDATLNVKGLRVLDESIEIRMRQEESSYQKKVTKIHRLAFPGMEIMGKLADCQTEYRAEVVKRARLLFSNAIRITESFEDNKSELVKMHKGTVAANQYDALRYILEHVGSREEVADLARKISQRMTAIVAASTRQLPTEGEQAPTQKVTSEAQALRSSMGPFLSDADQIAESLSPEKPVSEETGVSRQSTTELPRANVSVSPKSERIHAANFQDRVNYIQAKEEAQPLIVALGTSWIKGYEKGQYPQHDALNPLISRLGNCGIPGKTQFIIANDEKLSDAIRKQMGEEDFANARIIALAGEETITKDLAEYDNGKNVLMGVDNRYLTTDSYMRLMEMLEITANFALYPDIPPNSPNIPIEKRGKFWIFIPRAEPMNYETLKIIYEAQKFA